MSERKLIQACKRSDVKAVQVYYHITSFFSSKFCFFKLSAYFSTNLVKYS